MAPSSTSQSQMLSASKVEPTMIHIKDCLFHQINVSSISEINFKSRGLQVHLFISHTFPPLSFPKSLTMEREKKSYLQNKNKMWKLVLNTAGGTEVSSVIRSFKCHTHTLILFNWVIMRVNLHSQPMKSISSYTAIVKNTNSRKTLHNRI